MVSTKDKEQVERVSDIYVGYEEKGNINFNTVKEAISAISAITRRMKRTELLSWLVRLHREQVVISTPYVRLVNDEKSSGKEVLLTWYYGIG